MTTLVTAMPPCPARNFHSMGGAYSVKVLPGECTYQCNVCGCRYQWFGEFLWTVLSDDDTPHDPAAALPPVGPRPPSNNP